VSVTETLLLLPNPTGGWLALTPDEFTRARARAHAYHAPARGSASEVGDSYVGPSSCAEANGEPPAGSEGLLDAAGLAAKTEVPASWWVVAARQRRVPHYRMGRWVRFRLSEVLACPAVQNRRAVGHTSNKARR